MAGIKRHSLSSQRHPPSLYKPHLLSFPPKGVAVVLAGREGALDPWDSL